MQAGLQGVAQADDILRIKDELLAWTNFMYSGSVRCRHALIRVPL